MYLDVPQYLLSACLHFVMFVRIAWVGIVEGCSMCVT